MPSLRSLPQATPCEPAVLPSSPHLFDKHLFGTCYTGDLAVSDFKELSV